MGGTGRIKGVGDDVFQLNDAFFSISQEFVGFLLEVKHSFVSVFLVRSKCVEQDIIDAFVQAVPAKRGKNQLSVGYRLIGVSQVGGSKRI